MTESLNRTIQIAATVMCLFILTLGFCVTSILPKFDLKPVAVADVPKDLLMEGFDYTHWQQIQGQTSKDYRISADALGFEDKAWGMVTLAWFKNMAIYHPVIQFFKQDREFSRIVAGKAYVEIPWNDYRDALSQGTLVFEDNPQLISSDGRVLSCSRLRWQRQNDTISGSEGCQLMADNKVLQVNEMAVKISNF